MIAPHTALFALLWIAAGAWAQTATTLVAAELKKTPFSDAETLATLPGQTTVEILKREGGWYQVKTPNGQGWLRMLSVRMGSGEARKGDSGIGALLGLRRGGAGSGAVTTGVRGLSEEDLKNARPDPAELKKLERYTASAAEARKFAASAGLDRQQVDYPTEPRNGGGSSQGSSWGDQ